MKLTIIVFLAALVMLSCNSGTKKEVFKPQSDTAKLWGTYIDFPSKNIVNGATFMITTKAVFVDSFLNVNQIIDTGFFILPSIDTGRNFKRTIPGSVVYDLNIDTTVAKLKRFMAANKNLWDTTKVSTSSPQNKPIK